MITVYIQKILEIRLYYTIENFKMIISLKNENL